MAASAGDTLFAMLSKNPSLLTASPMMRWLSAFIILMILSAGAFSADDTSIRLAVLAEDASAESRALADLLTADLSQAAGVQVVERSEIDRVLAEQNLSAAGMVKTDQRIAIGRLLRAQGLVFVRYETRNKRWLARLVETRKGFQAGLFTQPYASNALADAANAVAKNLLAMTPKLSLDPAHLKMVSILSVNNATLSAQYDWIEDAVPTLLTEYIGNDPNIIVLERRQLGELLEESRLTSDAAKFSSSGILIDGELARTPGPITAGGETSVTFTVRFRDASLREIKQINQHGSLRKTDHLIVATARAALNALRDITHIYGSNTTEEAQSLLNLAQWHGSLWAADSAYALNTTNVVARDTLIKGLVERAFGDIHDATMEDNAQALARAERMCREDGIPLLKFLGTKNVGYNLNYLNYLTNHRTMMDPEIRRLLEPFRRTLRRELETATDAQETKLMRLILYGPAFFDNPLDGMLYTRSLFNTVTSDSSITPADRDHLTGFMLTQCAWTPELFESLTNAPDPVIRYYATVRLMRFHHNLEKRRPYALQAFQDLDAVLTREQALGVLYFRYFPGFFKQTTWFGPTIQDIISASPEQESVIIDKLFHKLEILIASTNLRTIVILEPQRYLTNVPPADAVRWIDAVKASNPTEALTGVPQFYLDTLLATLNSLRQQIVEKNRLNSPPEQDIQRRLLLSPDGNGCAWKPAWPSNVEQDWKAANIYPQRLFFEGDTLWIGLGGRPARSGKIFLHPCGLMQVDLKTGTILSCRIGKTQGPPVADNVPDFGSFIFFQSFGNQDMYPMAILPMFRWRDHIVISQLGAGVLLYPARATATWSGLKDVEIINEQSGLLSNYVQMLTCLDEYLYMVSGSVLMEWNSKTKSVSLITDTKQGMKESGGLPELDKTFEDIHPDTTNHCLIVSYRLWSPQRDGSRSSTQSVIRLYFPKTTKWQRPFPDSAPNRAPSSSDPQGRNCKVWPSSLAKTFDAQDWGKGTLAITGYGRQWKLEHFTRMPIADAMITQPTTTDAVSVLMATARAGDISNLQRLIAQGNNINIQDQNGYTLLISAIDAKQSETALWLIRQGADITLTNRTGGTPLVWAAFRDQTNVVTELLARNADPNAGFDNGQTALILAASNGNLDLIKLLIEKGAQTTSMDKAGRSAFTWAAYAPKPDVLEYFLQTEPEILTLNAALFTAANNNRTNNIALLLKHGADINTKNRWGPSLLINAARHSEPETLQFLIDHGAKVNDPSSEDYSALMMAAEKNRADNMRVLLRAGADLMHVDTTAGYRRTVFNYATAPEAKAVVLEALGQYLLRTGDDRP